MNTKLFLLALLLLPEFCAHAQAYSIKWFTVDGGGGTSTGGSFAVSATIGQPDAHPQQLAGGTFAIQSGFWPVVALQTSGAPSLNVTFHPQFQAVVVSWPSPSTGFVLQHTTAVNSTNWITAPQTVTDNGTNRFIVVAPPDGYRFYRLFKP